MRWPSSLQEHHTVWYHLQYLCIDSFIQVCGSDSSDYLTNIPIFHHVPHVGGGSGKHWGMVIDILDIHCDSSCAS